MEKKRVLDKKSEFPGISSQVAWWYRKGYRDMVKKIRPGLSLPKKIKTSEDLITLIKGYGFRNLEFGNYVTEEDKFNYLVAFYFAIYDMNKILGFNKNMGMDQMITVGYGSRGIGGTLAHYNPNNKFININRYTKTLDVTKPDAFYSSGGIRSFAHEYGHALDYILGGHVERNSEIYSLSMGRSTAREWNFSHFTTPMRNTMNILIHRYIWRNIKTATFTDSYLQIADEKAYYRQHNEIFARLFEKYIFWKLEKLHIKNLALTKSKYDKHVYATDKDMKDLVPIMDKLIGQMRGQIIQKAQEAPSRIAASRQGKLF